jgi:chromosome segregation ATPase
MGKITTGLDKLLRLLEEKGKQSVAEASARLGIDPEVVGEWVELLEHEQLVTVTYRFSKQFVEIKAQDATKKVVVNAKKVASERDAFHRKIDSAIHDLKHDTASFETLKSQYEKIQRSVKDELESVRVQMKELDRFEQLRTGINNKIEEQQKDFKKFTKEYDELVGSYDAEYKEFIAKIAAQQKIVQEIKKSISGLKDQKEEAEKSVMEGIEQLRAVSSELNEKLHELSSAEKKVEAIDKKLDSLESGAQKSKEQFIVALSKKIGQRKEALEVEQEELLRSTKDRVKHIEEYTSSGKIAYERFSSLFMDKIKTLDFFDDITKEKKELLKDMEELKKKVDTLLVTSQYAKVKGQIGDIESVMEKYLKRKESLKEKISQLLTFINK